MPRPTTSTVLSFVVTAALLAAVVVFHPSAQMGSVRRLVGIGGERILPAPPIEASRGAYAFAATQRGSDQPVAWDPCSPVPYAVNPAGMPEGARALVDRAVSRISAATGLAFEDDGDTDRRPFTGSFVPLGGSRPVVIGWADDVEFPQLEGAVAGIGGAASEEGGRGRRYYVTGGVVLDVDVFTDASVDQVPRLMEAIVLHELAHVVGLDHVEEPLELMFADSTGQVELGPGDREGLARLGSVPCG
ncbi:hypothetical protein SFC79_02625 [Nocardioides sp. S-58]|uniref:Matrixin n=1 Tax=Nocardioides renjunii TaxID=3095075 RepID=A0ABU5K6V5_9ACTN|nr:MULTISPECIES: hypothetical protein [unclassified Nocardioides]MDZ5660647.1 hypothetical protein [Nocardioides sp. S-58]WQQ21646.1 hypothetical protein SHK17_17340 [Nocardioides sp. S-34]